MENKAIYQQVGRRIEVKTEQPWNNEKRKTEIVFIGSDFNPKQIEEQVKQCIATR